MKTLALIILLVPAVTSDGVNAGMSTADFTAIQNMSTFTIALWAYRTGASALGPGERMVDRDPGWLFLNRGDGVNFAFAANRWVTTGGAWTATFPSANAWHHLMVTYDYGATTNDPIIYVDGSSVTVTEVQTPVGGSLNSDVGSTLYIGNCGAACARSYIGSLAEIAIWNTILTAGNAATLATGGNPLTISNSNLKFYLPLCNTQTPIVDRIATRQMTIDNGTYTAFAHPSSAPRCLINIFAPTRLR